MKKMAKPPKPEPKDIKVQNPTKQDQPYTKQEGYKITKKAGKNDYGQGKGK